MTYQQVKTSEWFPSNLAAFLSQDSNFRRDRRRCANLLLAERRRRYTCGYSYVTLDRIPSWAENLKEGRVNPAIAEKGVQSSEDGYTPSTALNSKVSVWHGDITRLEIDAIVCSTFEDLSYASGMSLAVHEAAGPLLINECRQLRWCEVGNAKVAFGYQLPAKLVIFTAGPQTSYAEKGKETLIKCYKKCLQLVLTHGILSIAFCCIGTGPVAFPKKEAASIALGTVRKWLEINAEKVDRIIFCTYSQKNWDVYNSLLPRYFPHQLAAVQDTNVGLEVEVIGSESELKIERERMTAGDTKEAKERAEAADRRITQQAETIKQLQQQIKDKEKEISHLGETVRLKDDRIRKLEKSFQESRDRNVVLEQELSQSQLQVANSDRLFQDIFQRLLGQLPQNQPHWVVQRNEVEMTEEVLGSGGWATVKVALFRGQRVAAKCLHNQIISAHNIRLFTREMNMAARARHPNLLQFIGATMDSEPIILSELMPTSLRGVLEQGKPLSQKQTISIASDVARALNYLHLTKPDPIIHRDVSSANVLLKLSGDSYEAKLSDYGSANFVRYSITVGPGNPLYSAPEVSDPKQHSPKMDVYSFGVLLVEMCSGELFDDFEELINEHIREWPRMVAVIRLCIRQDPQMRPSAADLIQQLGQL